MRRTRIIGLTSAVIMCLMMTVFADIIEFDPVDISDQWRFSKDVSYDNKEEVKSLDLVGDVYSRANSDLSDIRLINKAGDYVPYYIYNDYINSSLEEYVEYKSSQILSFTKDAAYITDYQIEIESEDTDVIGNAIELGLPAEHFYKEIIVKGSHDNKKWDHITSDIIYIVNGQRKTKISLGGDRKYAYYRLISVDDTGDIPISYLSLTYDWKETSYEQREKTKPVDYKVEVDKETKQTIIRIHNKDRFRINNINLKSNDNFNRSYYVYGSYTDGEIRPLIASGMIYKFNLEDFDVEDQVIPLTIIGDGFVGREYIDIVIENQDDEPIDIESVSIDYHVDKLVFKTTDASGLKLLFGNNLAETPSYDISSYQLEIESMIHENATLSNFTENDVMVIPEKEDPLDYKLILNIAVVVIAGLLGFVILKKK